MPIRGTFKKYRKLAAMPPVYVRAKREFAALKGRHFFSRKVSKRDVFYVTFCGVQKVTKKHAGLRPATSVQSSAQECF